MKRMAAKIHCQICATNDSVWGRNKKRNPGNPAQSKTKYQMAEAKFCTVSNTCHCNLDRGNNFVTPLP